MSPSLGSRPRNKKGKNTVSGESFMTWMRQIIVFVNKQTCIASVYLTLMPVVLASWQKSLHLLLSTHLIHAHSNLIILSPFLPLSNTPILSNAISQEIIIIHPQHLPYLCTSFLSFYFHPFSLGNQTISRYWISSSSFHNLFFLPYYALAEVLGLQSTCNVVI